MEDYKYTKKYVCRIYYLLILGLIVTPDFLSLFIDNSTIINGLALFFVLNLYYCFYKLYSKKILEWPKGILSFWIFIFLVVSVYILIRADWKTIIEQKTYSTFINPHTLSYVLPFIILLLPNKRYFHEIICVLFRCSLFVIPLWLLNANKLVQDYWYGEGIGVYLPFISAFLLGFPNHFSIKQNIINIVISSIYLVLMMLNARRNVSFSIFVYIFMSFFIYRIYLAKNRIKTLLVIPFAFAIMLILGDSLIEKTFNRLTSRVNDDSRSSVEELFFLDFYSSPTEDWIFGRGIDGGYYQETMDEKGNITDYRKIIETGYLNMVLHGGITYVLVVYLLLFYALFRIPKKNKENLFLLFIMLTFLLDSYTTNIVNPLSIRSIIFWLCIELGLRKKNESSKPNKLVSI